ncbi:hypothetical protein [Neobacillus sp. SuZ13]|nr:hypothetical protein [Neobacillus sp. SuZ13]WHY69738.1 hypothetical protein QNH17_14370 [Neobacillus sp. SuZ13]
MGENEGFQWLHALPGKYMAENLIANFKGKRKKERASCDFN